MVAHTRTHASDDASAYVSNHLFVRARQCWCKAVARVSPHSLLPLDPPAPGVNPSPHTHAMREGRVARHLFGLSGSAHGHSMQYCVQVVRAHAHACALFTRLGRVRSCSRAQQYVPSALRAALCALCVALQLARPSHLERHAWTERQYAHGWCGAAAALLVGAVGAKVRSRAARGSTEWYSASSLRRRTPRT